jgi:hypothetical protein
MQGSPSGTSPISNSHFGKIAMWERLSAAKNRGKMPLT